MNAVMIEILLIIKAYCPSSSLIDIIKSIILILINVSFLISRIYELNTHGKIYWSL